MKIINNNHCKVSTATMLFLLIIIFQTSCKKLIEVDAPVTSINAANVYNNDATAASVLTSIYANMSRANFGSGGITSLSLFPGLSADELQLYSGISNPTYIAYYTNSLTNSNLGGDFWVNIYQSIFVANSAIEGINNSANLTPNVKQQLIGEAKFIRAFCYFYLVVLYGDVPLALSSDWQVNSLLPRTSKAKVFQQIINDLKDAENLLSDKYLKGDALSTYMSGAEERVRPTKWAAIALLARTYLFTGEWANSEAAATRVIDNVTLFGLPAITDVFKKNSKESIWQLQPVNTGQNTQDARLFVIPSTGPGLSNPIHLNNLLVNSFSFNDLRRKNWIDSVNVGTNKFYYAYKYKVAILNAPVSEYLTVFRLAEQYLIRGEARAQQENITGSASDLNMIRNRASLPNSAAATQTTLLSAILNERQLELFTEWGHRWLDLKRTNTVDEVMNTVAPLKGASWQTTYQFYPISLSELQKNPNLVQNPGY